MLSPEVATVVQAGILSFGAALFGVPVLVVFHLATRSEAEKNIVQQIRKVHRS